MSMLLPFLVFHCGFMIGLGDTTGVHHADHYASATSDGSSTPLTGRFGISSGVDDWAIDIMGRSTALTYRDRERGSLVFEPALRHDVVHAGPLRVFARAEAIAGKVYAIWEPGTCDENGDCTSIVTPGKGIVGIGVGGGAELAVCTRDGGYFALTALASLEVASIGGESAQLTTMTFGFSFGMCKD
jgi:hypothetical protein